MIVFQKIDDLGVDLDSSQDEFDGLKSIVRYAEENYDDTNLEYANISHDAVLALDEELARFDEAPIPLGMGYLHDLFKVVSETDNESISDVTPELHKAIVEQMRAVDLAVVLGNVQSAPDDSVPV